MMFKTLTTVFAVLAIIYSGAANSDLAPFAYANEQGSRSDNSHTRSVGRMAVFFNENIYTIQQDSSKMEFRVDSPIGDVWASFHDFDGSFAMLNNGDQSDTASIEINAESLETDGGFIGALLKGERFFDVAKFPSMRFVGSSLEWYSDTRAVLKGYMTIKGVTRQVAFYVELVDADTDNRSSDRITVKASTTIKRSAFGISSLLPAVSDKVNLFISIDAVRQPSISMR